MLPSIIAFGSTTTDPSISEQFSCIATQLAPSGISAPVKILAAVPGSSLVGALPAGILWLTISVNRLFNAS